MTTKKKEPLVLKDIKNPHIKPTKEELDENAKKALEEAKKLKNKPKLDKKETKKPVEPIESKKPKKPEEQKKVNYKKKYIASQREGLILHEKNKKTNEALQKAMETPDPTEDELKQEYPDWDMMSDLEKKMAKDNLANTRRFKALEAITKVNKDLAKWEKKVVGFINDPQTLIDNPSLDGKQDEFRLFAIKPTRRGADFDVLISAFLYKAKEKEGIISKKKGAMFEQGTGGPPTKGKMSTNKITTEEARVLRKHDYKKFKRYLKQGLIEEPDL